MTADIIAVVVAFLLVAGIEVWHPLRRWKRKHGR